jgi:beta-glucuronidase
VTPFYGTMSIRSLPSFRGLPLRCLQWSAATALLAGVALAAAPTQRLSLNGIWRFTADYQNAGDTAKWFAPSYGDGAWDHVTVPHTWSHDPRFVGFVGAGWYRLRFNAPSIAADQHVRLHFGAVFARARVWLNGHPVGVHEGGYTPFSLDVSGVLDRGATNLLVVSADNRWDSTTLPGARGAAQPPEQVYAWWDDGGIIRDVELQVLPAIHVVKQKVDALPDLAAGTAAIRVRTWLRNCSTRPERVGVAAQLVREGERLPVVPMAATVEVPAGGEAVAEQGLVLPAEHVSLWRFDAPVLYEVRTVAGVHAADPVTFGLRRFESRGTEFLLNGHPIRLPGANWHASHPEWGQNQPVAGVIRDLQLMKEGGLVLQRFAHYPVSPAILDWADRHGMLMIAEAGNTGGTAEMLASEDRRAKFRSIHREMVERDWNHPSIIAWSVGNEFAADTPAGVRWVKDMVAYTRELDPTRPVTFASNTVAKPSLRSAADEGSAFVDFVCLNTYGRTPRDNAANIDRAHALHPDKPLLVTEYGIRRDFAGDETERIDWFREMLAVVRARPFVSGLSVWSFNDYRSRYVGTNPNGWREWGLVAPDRSLSGAYHALRREHSGFVLQEATLGGGRLAVLLSARNDFPLFPSDAECELRVGFVDGQNRPVASASAPLRVGAPMTFPVTDGVSGYRLEVWRGGFRTATFSHALAP